MPGLLKLPDERPHLPHLHPSHAGERLLAGPSLAGRAVQVTRDREGYGERRRADPLIVLDAFKPAQLGADMVTGVSHAPPLGSASIFARQPIPG